MKWTDGAEYIGTKTDVFYYLSILKFSHVSFHIPNVAKPFKTVGTCFFFTDTLCIVYLLLFTLYILFDVSC